jgi:hypothetical protein
MLHVSVRRRQSSDIKTLLTPVHLALKVYNFMSEDGGGQPKPVACDVRIYIFILFEGNVQIATNLSQQKAMNSIKLMMNIWLVKRIFAL